jgi:hypothetical protein
MPNQSEEASGLCLFSILPVFEFVQDTPSQPIPLLVAEISREVEYFEYQSCLSGGVGTGAILCSGLAPAAKPSCLLTSANCLETPAFYPILNQ